MLCDIPEMYFNEVLILLQWLAFAERPLSLVELAEASIIRPGTHAPVSIEDRGTGEDVLTLLSGLVQIEWHSGRSNNTWFELYDDISGILTQDRRMLVEESDGIGSDWKFQNNLKLRLAHFTVKEYLLSEDITKECAAQV
jgi:hypothetical protein